MADAALLIFAGAGLVATLTAPRALHIAGRDVHAADVAELQGPGGEALGQVIIARLPQGASKLVSRAQLAALVHRAIPAVQVSGGLSGDVDISSAAAAAPRASARPYVAEPRVVERGRKLTLVSAAGAVVVQRPVVALQAATPKDKRLFVQTGDGAVLSVPLAVGSVK